jgi:hypothetical protein
MDRLCTDTTCTGSGERFLVFAFMVPKRRFIVEAFLSSLRGQGSPPIVNLMGRDSSGGFPWATQASPLAMSFGSGAQREAVLAVCPYRKRNYMSRDWGDSTAQEISFFQRSLALSTIRPFHADKRNSIARSLCPAVTGACRRSRCTPPPKGKVLPFRDGLEVAAMV